MMTYSEMRFALWLAASGILSGLPSAGAGGQPVEFPAAPTCAKPAAPTPSAIEGPYYKPNSPRRHELIEEGAPGERVVLLGYVRTRSCQPVVGAVVDVWQANAHGEYDNVGFNMRGQEITDDQGRYWFETVVPGRHPGREPHIHVKVHAVGQHVLTTQIFLPDKQSKASSQPLDPRILVKIEEVTGIEQKPALIGRYDFVLNIP